jgi:Uma2 family endonuclease
VTHLTQVDPLLFEPGDRLDLGDFLARWERMPSVKFAELIDGVVYMPSPSSYEHGRRDLLMQLLLGTYASATAVCEAVSNATWLMAGSAPQPDVALRLLPQFGGKSTVSGKLAQGAPELVAEVCLSSRSFDLGPKLALYQSAGVAEYAAVLIEEQRVEWRESDAGGYRLLQPEHGVLRSRIFPGLRLDVPAFWAADSRRMLSVLQDGIESAECRDFLERLRGLAL